MILQILNLQILFTITIAETKWLNFISIFFFVFSENFLVHIQCLKELFIIFLYLQTKAIQFYTEITHSFIDFSVQHKDSAATFLYHFNNRSQLGYKLGTFSVCNSFFTPKKIIFNAQFRIVAMIFYELNCTCKCDNVVLKGMTIQMISKWPVMPIVSIRCRLLSHFKIFNVEEPQGVVHQ